MAIEIKGPAEIEGIRASCQIVYQVQRAIESALEPGITTLELDAIAARTIRDHGAVAAFKGYRGFPSSICTSVNAEAVHGLPGKTRLRQGDIISVDVGVLLEGYYGDGAFTLGIEPIDPPVQSLISTTRTCLHIGIEQARTGHRVSDISHAIQEHAEGNGFSVIREFGGHGIGHSLHEDPSILNHGPPGKGPRLHAGFVLAIEPILTWGSPQLVTASDGWTAATRSGTPAAHFEHTIAVTGSAPDILTLPPDHPISPALFTPQP